MAAPAEIVTVAVPVVLHPFAVAVTVYGVVLVTAVATGFEILVALKKVAGDQEKEGAAGIEYEYF